MHGEVRKMRAKSIVQGAIAIVKKKQVGYSVT